MGRFVLTVIKRLFIFSVVSVSILLATIAGLMYFGVTIDLGFLKSEVATSAQSVLGREVTIDGPVSLEFSTWPALDLGGVKIANTPSGKDPLLLSAERARVQIGVLPLLKGKIEIAEIVAEGVALNLENRVDGTPNWAVGSEREAPGLEPAQPDETASSEDGEPFFSLSGINSLDFSNIRVTYHDAALNKTMEFKLDELQGEAATGSPVTLDFRGHFQDYPYLLNLQSDPLDQLLSRQAQTWQFTLQGEVVEKQLSIAGDYDKGGVPQANLAFRIMEVDVGAVLARLGLVSDLEASTGSMEAQLTLRGDSMNEIVQQSSLSFSVRDGEWRIHSPTSDKFLDVKELAGDIVVKEGNAITMKLAGMVGELPVNFVITGAPLVDYVITQESVPLSIEAQFANSTLGFGGRLALPIGSRELGLFLTFKTDTLQNFNDLLGVDLPPVGPIDFSTKLELTDTSYEMPELDVRIGDSLLSGLASFAPSNPKPEVSIELVSEKIQINDFDGIVEALPKQGKGAGSASEESGTEESEGDETVKDSAHPKRKNLLSREVLNSFNGDLLVRAEEVLSGEDRLGSMTLKARVQGGLLEVDPLYVGIPGGGLNIGFDYRPGYDEISVNINAEIEEFDVGVLVRRKNPESNMGGLLFLDATLHSQTPNLQSMMEHAQGHFDFGLVPQNFSAGIIDLWAVNLISAIMTEVSEEEKSEINCFVVRLGVDQGKMAEKVIYMDTSNMRIGGKADVDFTNRSLNILLVPKAKKPEFFSLAVPIRIEGEFDDFGLGIGLSRITGAVISFITSPVHVPIRRIFVDPVPEDGKEACRRAWALTEEDGAETGR